MANEITIEHVADAMAQTAPTYPGTCWYNDPKVNDIINEGVKKGFVFRASVTQVEWTQEGVEALVQHQEAQAIMKYGSKHVDFSLPLSDKPTLCATIERLPEDTPAKENTIAAIMEHLRNNKDELCDEFGKKWGRDFKQIKVTDMNTFVDVYTPGVDEPTAVKFNTTIILQNSKGANAMEPISPASIQKFKTDETANHVKVSETKEVIEEQIKNFEFYRGYAHGMNGLIEKLQAKANLESVVNEVQTLSDRFKVNSKLNYHEPAYPSTKETSPEFMKGQINGIIDGVKTLRNIDMTKYVELAPELSIKPLPDYPALTKAEKNEHKKFVETMLKNYPSTDIKDLNALCGIAHEMAQQTNARYIKNSISEETFNTLTDNCEKKMRDVAKAFPKIGVTCDYEPRGAAIKLQLPDDSRNNLGGYAVPEISMHKLIPNTPRIEQQVTHAMKR